MIAFTVEMVPVGKARPRLGRGGRVFTPDRTAAAERLVALSCRAAMRGLAPLEGALKVRIEAVMPMAPSWSKRKRAESDGQPHTSRPDGDNLAKLALDAIEGIAFVNDTQVAELRVVKRWGQTGSLHLQIDTFPTRPG